eukprot:552369-Pelagomonas_calceolata.AAC.6
MLPFLLQWGDALSWPKLEPQDVPVQNNGSDCGVFAIKFAECAGTGRWVSSKNVVCLHYLTFSLSALLRYLCMGGQASLRAVVCFVGLKRQADCDRPNIVLGQMDSHFYWRSIRCPPGEALQACVMQGSIQEGS